MRPTNLYSFITQIMVCFGVNETAVFFGKINYLLTETCPNTVILLWTLYDRSNYTPINFFGLGLMQWKQKPVILCDMKPTTIHMGQTVRIVFIVNSISSLSQLHLKSCTLLLVVGCLLTSFLHVFVGERDRLVPVFVLFFEKSFFCFWGETINLSGNKENLFWLKLKEIKGWESSCTFVFTFGTWIGSEAISNFKTQRFLRVFSGTCQSRSSW